MQFCDLHNIDRILISAIQNKVEVYQLMGFKVIAEPKKRKKMYIHSYGAKKIRFL